MTAPHLLGELRAIADELRESGDMDRAIRLHTIICKLSGGVAPQWWIYSSDPAIERAYRAEFGA